MTPATPTAARPLYDAEAESALLGVVIVNNAVLDDLADVIEPTDFGRFHHGLTFAAMRKLHAAGDPVDPITLRARLERDGTLDEVGAPFIYGLGSGVPRSANVGHYARVIRDLSLLRQTRNWARRVIDMAEADGAIGAEVREQAEQGIFQIGQQLETTDFSSGAELAAQVYPMLEQIAGDHGAVMGVTSGLRDLDRMTRGFHPGELVLVGARPSMGKTAFALQAALNVATAQPVAVLSLEMSRESLAMRGIALLGQVDGWRLLSGRLTEIDMLRSSDGLASLGEAKIFVDDAAALSPLRLRSKLRRLTARVGRLGLVVVDYLQLMQSMDEDRNESRATKVAGISRALKVLARELSVPFVVLSQLNRALEGRHDKRPSMSDLRESGALEQDADVVLLLHRPEVYESTPANAGLAELIIAKQRNGPTGLLELTWHAAQMRFEHRTAKDAGSRQ